MSKMVGNHLKYLCPVFPCVYITNDLPSLKNHIVSSHKKSLRRNGIEALMEQVIELARCEE
ncbi:MAG: hypothetical protein RMJ31_02280 [Nitrososphaerota archaeon]|nr:hypothetical protein [Nitrososphaerota archaeon]